MKKKIYSSLLLTAMVVALALTSTACSSDNDPTEEHVYTTEYKLEVTYTEDYLNAADVHAYIVMPDGSHKDEAIVKTTTSWVLKGQSIPSKAGIYIEPTAKTGISDGTYNIGYQMNATTTCYDNGKVVNIKQGSIQRNQTVKAENIPDVMKYGIIYAGQIDSEGNASFGNGTDLDFGLNSFRVDIQDPSNPDAFR